MSFGRSIALHPLIDLLEAQLPDRGRDGERRRSSGRSSDACCCSARTCGRSSRTSVSALGRSGRPGLLGGMDPRQRRGRSSTPSAGSRCGRPRSIPRSASSRISTGWTRPPRSIWLSVADSVAASRVLRDRTYRPGYVHPFGERSLSQPARPQRPRPARTASRWPRASWPPSRCPAELQALIVQEGRGQSVLHRGGRQVAAGVGRHPAGSTTGTS